jgi:tetratricopeptide (TPR) repeat protein
VDAIKSCEAAAEILTQLVNDFPAVTTHQSQLAQCYNSIGVLFVESNQPLQAIEAFESGLSIQQKLASAFPSSTDIQNALAANFSNLAALHGANKDLDASQRNNDAALAIRESLAKSHPANVHFQTSLAESHTNRGNIFNIQGNPDAAGEAYEKAASVLRKLAREHPELPEVEFALGVSLHNSAVIDLGANRFEAAIERLNEAIAWQKKGLVANPASPRGRHVLIAGLNNLIAAHQGLGNSAGIEAAQRELRELTSADPELRKLNRKLAAVIDRLEEPHDNRERLVLAMHAYSTRRFATARELWKDAMVAAPSICDDRAAQHRYNAACSAVLAAAGLSEDKSKPEDKTIIQWRSEALVWLDAELVAWTEFSKSANSEQLAFIIQTLQHWKKDSDLASIRDSVSLKSLPETERESWESLWAKVDQLLETLD